MKAVLCCKRSRRRESMCRKKKRLLLLILLFLINTNRRRIWVHPILQKRESSGEFHRLVQELRLQRTSKFRTYFRMLPETFDKLLEFVRPYITKITTNFRTPIGPAERLATTLRYLVTGDSYQTIGFSFRMSKSMVSKIVPETCSAIWTALQPVVMPVPTEDRWKQIAIEFSPLWQFPNCLGAIDGKHILIQAPANTGSMFFNYKKSFSIVLLAVADAHYKFVAVDIGSYGKQSDGNVFTHSNFGQRLKHGQLDLPPRKPLHGSRTPLPHVFVADEAFPLRPELMRPFPGSSLDAKKRIFNYRLSRARTVVENAFGTFEQSREAK